MIEGNEYEISDFDADAVRALPFVSETADGVSFWDIEGHGHDATDINVGEHFAKLAIEAAKSLDMPVLIAMVIRDMITAGRFTALEAGFLAGIASAAKVGSLN